MTLSSQHPVYSTLAADPDLSELVGDYVAEMPERIQAMQNKRETGDWNELMRLAHQLKGAAGSYGFHEIHPVAAALEARLRSGDTEVDGILAQVFDLCSRVTAAIRPA